MPSCSFMACIKTTFPFTLKFWRLKFNQIVYKNLVPTSQKTCRFAIMKNSALLLLTQIISYCFTRPKYGVRAEWRLIVVTVGVQGNLNLSLSNPRRRIGWDEVWLHTFSISPLDWGVWSTSRPGRFIHWKECRYPFNRRLDGPRSRRGRFGEEKRRLRAPGIKVRIVTPIA
jgi:hypothetical protein